MVVREAVWRSFQDIRQTFNTADYVQGKVIFDIGGNKYRMVAVADYLGQRVIIRAIMTHAEYDRGRWRL